MSVETGCDAWLVQEMKDIGRLARSLASQPAGKTLHDICSANSAPQSDASGAIIHAAPDAAPVADLYQALVQGQYSAALGLCHRFQNAYRSDKAAIYAWLLLPVISKLGQDWAEDKISFEQSAFAFSLMHSLLDVIGRQSFQSQAKHEALKLGHVLVAVAPGDTHDFGARILTEYLSLQGWDVSFVDGRNTPEIAALLQSRRTEALALSISVDSAFSGLADMIADWRHVNASRHLEIIVGGSAIQPNRDQYGFLQADCVAMNLNEAAEHLLGQLVSGRNERPGVS